MVLHGPLNVEHQMDEKGPKPVEEQRGPIGARSLHSTTLAAVVSGPAFPTSMVGARSMTRGARRLAEIELGLVMAAVTPGPPGRVLTSELFIRDAANLMDLVGADALLERGEPGAIGNGAVDYAHRFAHGTAIYGGTTDIVRNMIAERFMGMPRSRPTG